LGPWIAKRGRKSFFTWIGKNFRTATISHPGFRLRTNHSDEYLDRTLFYRQRSFTREEFAGFMFAQSKEYPETREILDKLASSRNTLLGPSITSRWNSTNTG